MTDDPWKRSYWLLLKIDDEPPVYFARRVMEMGRNYIPDYVTTVRDLMNVVAEGRAKDFIVLGNRDGIQLSFTDAEDGKRHAFQYKVGNDVIEWVEICDKK
jgi:hypothetical protein